MRSTILTLTLTLSIGLSSATASESNRRSKYLECTKIIEGKVLKGGSITEALRFGATATRSSVVRSLAERFGLKDRTETEDGQVLSKKVRWKNLQVTLTETTSDFTRTVPDILVPNQVKLSNSPKNPPPVTVRFASGSGNIEAPNTRSLDFKKTTLVLAFNKTAKKDKATVNVTKITFEGKRDNHGVVHPRLEHITSIERTTFGEPLRSTSFIPSNLEYGPTEPVDEFELVKRIRATRTSQSALSDYHLEKNVIFGSNIFLPLNIIQKHETFTAWLERIGFEKVPTTSNFSDYSYYQSKLNPMMVVRTRQGIKDFEVIIRGSDNSVASVTEYEFGERTLSFRQKIGPVEEKKIPYLKSKKVRYSDGKTVSTTYGLKQYF